MKIHKRMIVALIGFMLNHTPMVAWCLLLRTEELGCACRFGRSQSKASTNSADQRETEASKRLSTCSELTISSTRLPTCW
jgi:hypothetical protein